MRFDPTMKQAVIRRTARKFAEAKLALAAAEMDRTGHFPWDIAEEMAELNYFGIGMQIPLRSSCEIRYSDGVKGSTLHIAGIIYIRILTCARRNLPLMLPSLE